MAPRSKLMFDEATTSRENKELRKSSSLNDLEDGSRQQTFLPQKPPHWLPITTSLPILVLIDMFAVSLVVPLLFQYYKRAGITSANQREWLSSLFSCSQIVGGLMMGVLTDAHIIQRRTMLFLSFGGSAVSYALIVYGGLPALVISRILVGLVKQTMTVTTTLLTRATTKENRTKHMGRLTAATTTAWVAGPSVGALLFKYVDPRAPALLACALFTINVFLAAILLPSENYNEETIVKRKISIVSNLKSCFSSTELATVVASKLIFTFVSQATSYSQLGSFYEDMYGLEPHHRGYISSFQQFLQILVQSTLVGPVLSRVGGERLTAVLACCFVAVAVFLEARRNLAFFLIVLCPMLAICFSMMNVSLQSLVTHVAPQNAIFSVLAALDVMQNAVSVTVPFYRTALFARLSKNDSHHETEVVMQGDPDPVAWVLTSAFHWTLAAIAMAYFLLQKRDEERKDKGR